MQARELKKLIFASKIHTIHMLSISHALTGAFLASKLQNPVLYVPTVLVSHYVEDWILHWDVGTGLTSGTRNHKDAFLLELIDLGITVVLVFALFQIGKTGINLNAWLGAFVALIPDFIEAPRNFFHYNPWWIKPFNDFHHGVHNSTPNVILGLLPQAVILGLILLLR